MGVCECKKRRYTPPCERKDTHRHYHHNIHTRSLLLLLLLTLHDFMLFYSILILPFPSPLMLSRLLSHNTTSRMNQEEELFARARPKKHSSARHHVVVNERSLARSGGGSVPGLGKSSSNSSRAAKEFGRILFARMSSIHPSIHP